MLQLVHNSNPLENKYSKKVCLLDAPSFFLSNTHNTRTIHGQYTHNKRTIPITSVKDNNDYLGLNITASITSLQVFGIKKIQICG